MNNANLLLKEAYNSFKKGRYEDSSVLLEKYCDSHTGDPFSYLLLSISYLQTNKLITAQSALKKMLQIDPDYPPGIQLQAYLYMKAAPDMKSAMTYYVELLGKYSRDSGIRRAISVIRKANNFQEFQRNAKLFDFVKIPRYRTRLTRYVKKNRNRKRPVFNKGIKRKFQHNKIIFSLLILSVLIAAVFLTAVFLGEIDYKKIYRQFFEESNGSNYNETIDQITVDGSGFSLIEKIVKRRTPEFYYSSDELLKDFRRAKILIKSGRCNSALSILNRISNSNANHSVRERSEFLRRFIMNIDEREWQKVNYLTVKIKPYLYTGFSVEWAGRTANIKRREGKIVFNLLVDYRSNNEFSGIVDVYSDNDYSWLKNGDEVAVKAVIVNAVGSEQKLYLTAKEIEKK